MIVLVAVSGCTININTGGNEPSNIQTSEQNNTNVVEPANTQTNNNSANAVITNTSSNNTAALNNSTNLTEELEPEIIINETIAYEDTICSSLSVNELSLTTLEQDTEANAKSVSVCSVNKDVMNSVNQKYYTFTITEPTKIYLMIDGFESGAWQVGIIGKSFEQESEGQAVKYSEELPAGTYTVYARLTNALASTCTNENCCFEFAQGSTCYWIKGEPANGIIKLGFRLTVSTSELEPSNTIEQGTATMTPVSQSCLSLSAKTIDKTVLHDTIDDAYLVSMCDEVTDVFTASQYQYYSFTLTEQTNVKLTLNKPEGAWQIGITGHSWEDSTTLGQELIEYKESLPIGEYTVWVKVANTAGLSGTDWSCRQIITDGTCYWINGSPVNGTYYLNYNVTFDTE
jgi:hypothetical protein